MTTATSPRLSVVVSGWDVNSVRPCDPGVNGGYSPSRTNYGALGKLDAFRAFNLLVETADDKRPQPSTLGTDDQLFVVNGLGDGHVPRNLRLAVQLIDVVQPYVVVVSSVASGRVGGGSGDGSGGRVLRLADGAAALAAQHPRLRAAAHGWRQRSDAAGGSARAVSAVDVLEQYTHRVEAKGCADDAVVHVALEWDVGGGYRVDATRIRVGAWPSDVPPSVLQSPAAPSELPRTWVPFPTPPDGCAVCCRLPRVDTGRRV